MKDGADHYETKRLWEALTNYGYMPRLANVGILRDAVAAVMLVGRLVIRRIAASRSAG